MFSFIILHYTFQDTDMERNMLLIDGQQNSVSLIVDVDQIGLQVFWKFFFVLIALDFAAIDILLLFEVTVEMLMTPFYKFLQFLYLQSTLMLISFLLVLQSFIRSLNDLSSPVSFNNIVAWCWCYLVFILFFLLLIFEGIGNLGEYFWDFICQDFLAFFNNNHVITNLYTKSFSYASFFIFIFYLREIAAN